MEAGREGRLSLAKEDAGAFYGKEVSARYKGWGAGSN